MTDDERKAWLDSLRPGDEVIYCERQYIGDATWKARATVTAAHPDCFILRLRWPDAEARIAQFVSQDRRLPRQYNHWGYIDPMTDDERRKLCDGDRRAWIANGLGDRDVLETLTSDDLRRIADILGYKEPTE